MICLHCGHCCLNYLIVIVKDPEKGITEKNCQVLDGSTRCPHLEGSKLGEYNCKIHHYSWFKETPCGQYDQIEQKISNCRMGEYLLRKLNEKLF